MECQLKVRIQTLSIIFIYKPVVIFSKLGSPTEEEIQKIESEEARESLLKIGSVKPCPIQEIFPAFPANTDECKSEKKIRRAIDLMLRLLQFDVEKRITAEEALKHKYFYRVKEPQLEVQHKPVRFAFEEQTLDREQIRVIYPKALSTCMLFVFLKIEMIVEIINKYNENNLCK
ncbi:Protein kinase domain containing protein [Reticulomyxa filosa]|uniref:Protein kinase domain containing protein n=1 Tax=Reticulomyxa filosa TaxID=46433 RepID=X6MS57_RETFI|nr:Protein kinase domain containing protein [Reticulomyxa filosa]|eukprot:ETO16501.1 Protein kinase domain containing protein [Reticulomyxa filosa]